jgi:hypothetical protein
VRIYILGSFFVSLLSYYFPSGSARAHESQNCSPNTR